MKQYYKEIIKTLDRLKINYILGADSLVGFSEGDVFKYSSSLHLYLFPYSKWQFYKLVFLLLFNKIILKPKGNNGIRFYRLRYKPSLFEKDSNYAMFSLFHKTYDSHKMYLGGKNVTIQNDDLGIEQALFEDIKVNIPQNLANFIQKYRSDLMLSFYKKHSVSFDSDSEKKAIKLLFDVDEILKRSNANYWIEGGTLLGAVRDKKLIPWDHDLDLGVKFTSDSEMKKLISNLKKKYYVSVKEFKKNDGLWQLGNFRVIKIYPRKNQFFKEDLCLDLFVYYLGTLPNETEEVYKYVVWDRNAFHRKEFFDKIEEIDFYGKKISVPSNPEKFLEVKYGENWRTPVKEWNVALDDGSIYNGDNH
ncbi:MAG: LicD family protein [Nitrosopumilus sp.]|nr:LicD family protein [Nitrosopumilus sp.]